VLGNAKGVVAAVVSVIVFGNLVTLQVRSCAEPLLMQRTPLRAKCAQAQTNPCPPCARTPGLQCSLRAA